MHMKKVFIFCNYEPLAFLIERIVTLHFSAEIILSDRKMEAFDMYYLFEPDLVVIDLDEAGNNLLREIKAVHPSQRVLGLVPDSLDPFSIDDVSGIDKAYLISKPFHINELIIKTKDSLYRRTDHTLEKN